MAFFRSIRVKLLLTILGLLVLATGSISSMGLYFARQVILNDVEDVLRGQIEARADQINEWLLARKSEVELLSATPELRSMDRVKQMEFLSNMAKQMPQYSSIWVSDVQGSWYSIAGTTGSIADRDYYPTARDGKTVISSPLLGRADGKLAVVVAAPITDGQGKVLGILGGNVRMQDVQQVVSDLKVGETGYAFLADQSGMIVAHPNEEYILKQNVSSVADGAFAHVAQKMMEREVGTDSYVLNGTTKRTAFAPISIAGWSVAFSVPEGEVLAPLNRLMWNIVLTAAITLVLAVIVGFFIPNQFLRPIRSVRSQLLQLAEGGGDLTQEINITHRDEMGELVEAFNAFLRSLREMIRQAVGSAEQVSSSSLQLSSASGHLLETTNTAVGTASRVAGEAQTQEQAARRTTDVVDQLRSAISQIATGAQDQARESQDTAVQVAQMVESVDDVLGKAQNVQSSSQRAASSARSGTDVIQSTIKGMERIRTSSDSVATEIRDLGQLLDRIVEMTEVITGIADQTNLLALNAAIEAARAGEHGRGFAVVAEEVRKLAEKSGSSAQDIASLTDQIMHGTTKVTDAVEAEVREIEEDSKMAVEAQRAMEEILVGVQQAMADAEKIVTAAQAIGANSREVAKAVDSVAAVTEENTAATEEMAAGADEVTRSVLSVADVLSENVAAVETIASSMQEMSGLATQMANSTEKLSGVAAELHRQMSQFKV